VVKRKHFDSFVDMLRCAKDYFGLLAFREGVNVQKLDERVKESPGGFVVENSWDIENLFQNLIEKTEISRDIEGQKLLYRKHSEFSKVLEKGIEIADGLFLPTGTKYNIDFRDNKAYQIFNEMLLDSLPKCCEFTVFYLSGLGKRFKTSVFGWDWAEQKWYVDLRDDYTEKIKKVEWTE
jgi:hypothetical protein